MKAVGITQTLPLENEHSMVDLEIDRPAVSGKDLLVSVKAISVNPVDTKMRAAGNPADKPARVLGWDAAGEVVAIGNEVKDYAVGDSVFYAGDITRAGSNCEFHLVDERIVGRKPTSLDYAQAAALPLTTITAWEGLFDRLGISNTGADAGKSILIIGAAGGVGSIAIQLASKLAQLKVIATASRPETTDWVTGLGADQVVNHRNPLNQEFKTAQIAPVDYILCLNDTAQHWTAMAKVIAAQGRICSIVETESPLDLMLLKRKCAGFVWESMFTRSMYQTSDMIEQQRLLNAVADLLDNGTLQGTAKTQLGSISAANLRRAHELIEQGSTIGKIVLAGWN